MNDKIKEKLTILVCTCDTYEDLWYPFFKLLDTYWPNNKCEIILNTETKSYSYGNLDIKSYAVGNTSYGKRLLDNISHIKTDFTLLMLDDFFIRRKVKEDTIESIINTMVENPQIACISTNKSVYIDENERIGDFYRMNKFAPVKLNMQAGIWRTESLKKYWREYDTPWLWEAFANYTTFDSKDLFYCMNNRELSPIYYAFNPEGMGVYRGKWVLHDVKPLFEKHGIIVDYNKRGVYNPKSDVMKFPMCKTQGYLFKRLPLKFAIGIPAYSILKKSLSVLGIKLKKGSLESFLAEINKKS